MEAILVEVSKCLSVFALAFFSFWPAVPAGLALGLSPAVVIVTTTLSYACGVGVVTFFGERVRAWVMKRFVRGGEAHPEARLRRIWDRYGVMGLGLAAPMTVGAQIGALLGMALDAQPRRLFFAMSFGALAWSIALTAASVLGILGVRAVM